jgi:hypothetical protein
VPGFPRLEAIMALAQIKSQIEEAKIHNTDQLCQSFMPEGCLSEILNIENVTEALSKPEFRIPSHKRDSTARIILEEAKKVFAILLELNCEKYLTSFIENDYLDSSLPLRQSTLVDVIPQSAAIFERLQYDYLVYFFRKSQYHRKIRDCLILPYVSQERIGGGGFSSVYGVLVHSSHQDLVQPTNSKVRNNILSYSINVSWCS